MHAALDRARAVIVNFVSSFGFLLVQDHEIGRAERSSTYLHCQMQTSISDASGPSWLYITALEAWTHHTYNLCSCLQQRSTTFCKLGVDLTGLTAPTHASINNRLRVTWTMWVRWMTGNQSNFAIRLDRPLLFAMIEEQARTYLTRSSLPRVNIVRSSVPRPRMLLPRCKLTSCVRASFVARTSSQNFHKVIERGKGYCFKEGLRH